MAMIQRSTVYNLGRNGLGVPLVQGKSGLAPNSPISIKHHNPRVNQALGKLAEFIRGPFLHAQQKQTGKISIHPISAESLVAQRLLSYYKAHQANPSFIETVSTMWSGKPAYKEDPVNRLIDCILGNQRADGSFAEIKPHPSEMDGIIEDGMKGIRELFSSSPVRTVSEPSFTPASGTETILNTNTVNTKAKQAVQLNGSNSQKAVKLSLDLSNTNFVAGEKGVTVVLAGQQTAGSRSLQLEVYKQADGNSIAKVLWLGPAPSSEIEAETQFELEASNTDLTLFVDATTGPNAQFNDVYLKTGNTVLATRVTMDSLNFFRPRQTGEVQLNQGNSTGSTEANVEFGSLSDSQSSGKDPDDDSNTFYYIAAAVGALVLGLTGVALWSNRDKLPCCSSSQQREGVSELNLAAQITPVDPPIGEV